MPNDINSAADALLARMSANASQAEQVAILQRIEQRLKILGGESMQEMWARFDEPTKRLCFERAVDRLTVAQILEMQDNDPYYQEMLKSQETEDDRKRVENAKIVARQAAGAR